MKRFLIQTLVCWLAFGCLSFAQTFTLLHDFASSPDGNSSFAGLIRNAQGNLFGTTCCGGTFGFGTVFKTNGAGKETVLYSFAGPPDGAFPHGALIGDAAGNLYGTTSEGGTSNFGTVFKVDPTGHETVLYNFVGNGDGKEPLGRLTMDAAGNLYGTTQQGGAADCGTVFKLDSTGNETVLYTFAGGNDGCFPEAGVVRDGAGNLYGTTFYGGLVNSCIGSCGVVFKVSPSGKEAVLYRFTGTGGDGNAPQGDLIRDAATGNLYGTTAEGGAPHSKATVGNGIVFKLDAAGNETVLYAFLGTNVGGDGANPTAGLVRDAAGNFYGTTSGGGAANFGTVFQLDAAGHESVLYTFTGGPDGATPFGGLMRDAAGTLYGTSWGGGKTACGRYGCGSVFKLTP